MQVQYCRGWSLAESYYQSLSGPYQLLIIGDPLCRPWAKKAKPPAEAAATGGGQSVLTTVPPATEIAPTPAPSGETLAPGLALAIDGGTPIVVKDTFDGGWLANLIKEPGKRFILTGYFDVPKQDLFQIQLKTNTGAVVKISGAQILNAHDDKQLFAPALLSPGRHRIEIRGIAPTNPNLDIRLGSAGVQHLSEAQFKHARP